MPKGPRIAIAGAAPDTGNLGVSALLFSILDALQKHRPTARILVFDHGRGRRHPESSTCADVAVEKFGLVNTRALHAPEGVHNLHARSRLHRAGFPGGRMVRLLQSMDVVLDVSGGDSFTDLYGGRRFNTVSVPKRAILALGLRLILLPQTYGPYSSPSRTRIAREIVSAAQQAWARDARSYHILRDLLGEDFDASRHQVGVDMAFGLEARKPAAQKIEALKPCLEHDGTLVGINVSGLLMNDPSSARRFGLPMSYGEIHRRLVESLLEDPEVRIALIPHVETKDGKSESDVSACGRLLASLPGKGVQRRVFVAPFLDDPREVKWLISRMDWFSGTRMHSAIAALSSGIPTAGIAYSDKMRGVFESCGQESQVFDPRSSKAEDLLRSIRASFDAREEIRQQLESALPSVRRTHEEQMQKIAAECSAFDPPS